MENNNVSNTDRLKSSLCYIPFLWIFFHFAEQKKSTFLMKHIKYWTFLFIWFILVRLVFSALFLGWLLFGWFLFIIYLWLAIYFWMKAYNWENFNIEAIDNIFPDDKKWDQNTSNENATTDKEEEVKKIDEFDEDWKSNGSVIKTNNVVVNKIASGISNMVQNVKKDNKDEFAEEDDTVKKQEESKKNDDVLDF